MKQRLAIIGTGIAGMGCAHYLKEAFDLTLFEKNDYPGGHTNTIFADEDGKEIPIDTGFMVFNHVTYPLFTKLLSDLQVPTTKTDMSFSVQHLPSGLEYCGSGFNGLFAQRGNIFSVRHIKMLKEISRFNRESVQILEDTGYDFVTLADYIRRHKFCDDMLWKYLVPMSSAVWSTPMDTMLQFPAKTLVRFFFNHGFLGLNTQHQWYTVNGGSRQYREKLIAPFKDRIRLNSGVINVRRKENEVLVSSVGGEEQFDKVIIATHADEALAMLIDPGKRETELLSPFKYAKNSAMVHTDGRSMPKLKRVWSSWNYRIEEKGGEKRASTIYWMNSLQHVSRKKDYFVSINDPGNIERSKIIKELTYTHPLFTVKTSEAQKELPELNRTGPVYYCGSYFRYGFHEDALWSALELSKNLLAI